MSEHCYCRPGTDYCLHISCVTSQRVKDQRDFSEPYKVFEMTFLFFSDLPSCWIFFFQLYLESKEQLWNLLKSSCRSWLPSQAVQTLKSRFNLAPITRSLTTQKVISYISMNSDCIFLQCTLYFWIDRHAESKVFVCFMLVLGPGLNRYFLPLYLLYYSTLVHPERRNHKNIRIKNQINPLESWKY